MSTAQLTRQAARHPVARAEVVDRHLAVRQYSIAQIFAVWAAAALPMAALAWLVAPALADRLSGAGNLPIAKALLVCLTVGEVWQFTLVAALVWHEQRTLRWSRIRDALWLRSPRSPRSGRVGGKLWLVVIPLIVLFAVGSMLPAVGVVEDHDFASFLDSDAGQAFLSGAWGWFALIVLMLILNTVVGEELLFRGLLLPRMNRVFGRGDWAANGLLFAAYHLHVPWGIPAALLADTFALAYPSKRYQSAWIGIAVHSAQSVVFIVILLTVVL
jgi:membrane protease YdiL (CAAX protease family)